MSTRHDRVHRGGALLPAWALPAGALAQPAAPALPAGIGVWLAAAAAATVALLLALVLAPSGPAPRRRDHRLAAFVLGLFGWALLIGADAAAVVPVGWRATVLGAASLLLVLPAAAVVAAARASRKARVLAGVAIALVVGVALFGAGGAALPYAGLVLALLVAGCVAATRADERRQLESAHAELGRRFDAQRAELNAAVEQMRASRDRARAADQAKTRFLAAASHDLRQPAHAFGLYLEALRAAPPAEQAEISARMAASLAALDSMFAALLDVSRIDAGAVTPRWQAVALAPLLRRLADEAAPEADARGLRLALRVPAGDAVTVSDELLLERVLRNLLANALKYTRHGGVLLACRSRRRPDGGSAWRVEVWDTGSGIAAADQELVFEEFFQVGNPGRDRTKAPGLGLGLAIVRRLVGLLQLRLVLRSVPGRGSVFIVDGLAVAGPETRKAAAQRRQMRRLDGTLVAVIDDDADVRDATGRLLRRWGCRVVDAGDANALLQRLGAHADGAAAVPQAIVADLRLADGRRGDEEAAALFGAWGRRVPLLLVSGETAPDELRRLAHGAGDCLAKPVSPARLRAWLEAAVDSEMPEPTG